MSWYFRQRHNVMFSLFLVTLFESMQVCVLLPCHTLFLLANPWVWLVKCSLFVTDTHTHTLTLPHKHFSSPFQVCATWKRRTPVSLSVSGVLLASRDSRVSAVLSPPTASFTRTLPVCVCKIYRWAQPGSAVWLTPRGTPRAHRQHYAFVCLVYSRVNTGRNENTSSRLKYTK